MNFYRSLFRYLACLLVSALLYFGCSEDPDPGINSLVNVTTIQPGADCPAGGILIESGLDQNRDGVLSADEVEQSNLVCNGEDGVQTLVITELEIAGENCPNGGIIVSTGGDTNANGILDADEVTSINYVCNGVDGINSLVDVLEELPGDSCEFGGSRVISGLDLNRNDTLDTDEIVDIAFICNPQSFVDPADPDALSRALGIDGSTLVTGTIPAPEFALNDPSISNNQSSALVVAGNTVFLPFTFSTSAANPGYAGCFVQVNGATTFFDIPDNSSNTDQSGQIVIPVQIPGNILVGNFDLQYCIYDVNGRVSNILSTRIAVDELQSCPFFATGSEGLSIFTFDLGAFAGTTSVSYEMYTIPDRIDVFYNDAWVAGTGSSLGPDDFPPINNTCSVADGYVSGSGSFQIPYDPAISRELVVYMSGCIGRSTAWDLNVSCPF